ncbi:MAG TPA: hypothetical protein DDY13_19380 [Cytophagales bacterium]|nr:hypothetical protein [Cytophagales bacterium]
MQFHRFVLFGFALLIICAGCNQKKVSESEAHLGKADLVISGNEEAKAHFNKGLLLLHSFEYFDAREAFIAAQKADPSCSMAYWGEAMTHHWSLWSNQKTEEARAALKKLGASPESRQEKANKPIEKDFLKGADVLFFGSELKQERDKKYAEYMAGMHEKYPENQDVAAFYALSLLGSVSSGRDEKVFGKAAKIAEGILQENPEHPGALHYLIHSYDDPDHAKKALDAAYSYAKTAPDAAHALHMPSHIFVALGMWDEVVRSNIDSYGASITRMQQKELDNDARSYHALHWLLYGYLQKKNYSEAENIMRDMDKYTHEKPSKRARAYHVAMKGAFLAETGQWGSDIGKMNVKTDDLNLMIRAQNSFNQAMVAAHEKDWTEFEKIIDTLSAKIEKAQLMATTANISVCSNGGFTSRPANQLDVDRSKVVLYELQAINAMEKKEIEKVDRLLSKASELESGTSYMYGPPEIVMPSYELYGQWLLEQNRYEEALNQFELSLERGPNRANALQGKLNALANMGRDDEKEELARFYAQMISS